MNQPPNAPDRILVVDDEPEILTLLAYHLEHAGYDVRTAANGSEALAKASSDSPTLLVLDLMLPDIPGFDVLAALRENPRTRDLPVLLLTALRQDTDRIRGLSLGADDYLTKPFNPEELVLRVAAILRRGKAGRKQSDVRTFGRVVIDRRERRVRVDGNEVDLTPTEYRLLFLLSDDMGQVQPRQHLLKSIWGADPDMQTRTVDVHIQRLRSKLGVAGEMIETVRGFGYRFNPDGGAPA